MRRFSPIALLLASACASAGGPSVPVNMGPNSNRVIAADGRAASFGSGTEQYAHPELIEAPFDKVWTAVMAAYGATELPLDLANQGGGQMVSRFVVNGDMVGLPVSTFLACGSAMGVAEVADHYQVDVDLQILFIPVGSETEVHTMLSGSARDRFTNTSARPCLTKGILEDRLAERARERLGLATQETVVAQRPGLSSYEAGNELGEIPPAAERISLPPSHPLLLTLGGVAGGAVGTLLGSRIGADCETRCFNARGSLGPLVANTVLIPLGAHALNRGRGKLVQSFLLSSGWAALATVIGGLTEEDWAVWAVAPGQLVTSVLIERNSTGARR